VPGRSRFVSVITFALSSVFVLHAEIPEPPQHPDLLLMQASRIWQEALRNPVLYFLASPSEAEPASPAVEPEEPLASACAVAPLDQVEDPAALQFESSQGLAVVDVESMLPDAARAAALQAQSSARGHH
jgi:hypothetical protein